MIINDLEFINVCDQVESTDSSTIHGGASAYVGVGTSANDSNVAAYAGAEASGDISAAATGTSTALINGNGYNAGYATGYGAAYAVDRNGNNTSATGVSTSIV